MNDHIARTGANPFDAIKRIDDDADEHWSARELMPLLGYGADWRNFDATIERARFAAANVGLDADRLFVGVTENSGGRPRADVRLTRYAAYLVAMNALLGVSGSREDNDLEPAACFNFREGVRALRHIDHGPAVDQAVLRSVSARSPEARKGAKPFCPCVQASEGWTDTRGVRCDGRDKVGALRYLRRRSCQSGRFSLRGPRPREWSRQGPSLLAVQQGDRPSGGHGFGGWSRLPVLGGARVEFLCATPVGKVKVADLVAKAGAA